MSFLPGVRSLLPSPLPPLPGASFLPLLRAKYKRHIGARAPPAHFIQSLPHPGSFISFLLLLLIFFFFFAFREKEHSLNMYSITTDLVTSTPVELFAEEEATGLFAGANSFFVRIAMRARREIVDLKGSRVSRDEHSPGRMFCWYNFYLDIRVSVNFLLYIYMYMFFFCFIMCYCCDSFTASQRISRSFQHKNDSGNMHIFRLSLRQSRI